MAKKYNILLFIRFFRMKWNKRRNFAMNYSERSLVN